MLMISVERLHRLMMGMLVMLMMKMTKTMMTKKGHYEEEEGEVMIQV